MNKTPSRLPMNDAPPAKRLTGSTKHASDLPWKSQPHPPTSIYLATTPVGKAGNMTFLANGGRGAPGKGGKSGKGKT